MSLRRGFEAPVRPSADRSIMQIDESRCKLKIDFRPTGSLQAAKSRMFESP